MEFAQSSKKYNIFVVKTHFKSMQTIGPVFQLSRKLSHGYFRTIALTVEPRYFELG